ncbi:MAG TPA: endo-1,4-beta-xylanase [Steroidobacteraceae bacterium]|jgi:endo-1,4-beta-xylanase|nr:endo-1,4-beta-xylanase [Steroidobacteraceae bacterium]
MRISTGALVRACLLASVSVNAFAQTEPVIIQAESGTFTTPSQLSTGTLNGDTYITIASTIGGGSPPTADRTATYTVTFPHAGNYELYARFRVGPTNGGADDDSFFIGNGFGAKSPAVDAQWTNNNNVNNGGFTVADTTVVVGGTATTNVFKWFKLTGSGNGNPAVWVVPDGALTQTLSFGGREDGLFMDKIAFGVQGSYYLVSDLDNGTAAHGTPPPPDPPAYTRTDPPLATGKPKFLGSAFSPGAASTNFTAYWNQVTPENGGKWGSVEGTQNVMNFVGAHQAYDLARANGFKFKWHALVWGNQQPAWLNGLVKPPNDPVAGRAAQLAEIEQWFAAIATEFPDLEQIDVVNEPLHDPPCTDDNGGGFYCEALGGAGVTGWDWVIKSFELARQYFPHAQLLINDYSITNDDNATTRYLEIINLLKARGLIDAIGDQAHAFSTTEAAPMTRHKANLDRLAATGLPIYITEFDVDGNQDEVQLANYQRIFPTFWEHPAVKGVTLWGYVRGSHWRNAQGDWLLYQNGAERPALQWLIKYVANTAPTVSAGQSFNVSESAAAGTAVGTVLATDPDAATVLSQWQLTDASGKFVIDATTGTLSLAPGATLDFESKTAYSVSVSVWDGYVRSAAANVAINVTNLNDNAPAITGAQVFDIDGGAHNVIDALEVSDADDINQLGFTTFSNFALVSGNTNSVFRLRANSGVLEVARPLFVDWRKTSYLLTAKVSDGTNTSAVQGVTVNIPKRVNFCLVNFIRVEVPKATAPLAVLLGGELGDCRRAL